jgi:addiction module RelB/DinJ family antitoxin
MATTGKVTVSVTVDSDVKETADKILEEVGLSMSAAVNTFLKATVRCGGIPFPLTTRRLPIEYALVSLEEEE